MKKFFKKFLVASVAAGSFIFNPPVNDLNLAPTAYAEERGFGNLDDLMALNPAKDKEYFKPLKEKLNFASPVEKELLNSLFDAEKVLDLMVVLEKGGAIYTPEEFEMAIATTEETKNIAQKLFVFKRIYDGIQLEKQGNAAAAQIAYNQAFSVDPNYLPNYYFRGAMYIFESKNPIKAVEDFNKAVEMAPNSSMPYFARATFNYVLQNYNDSLTDVNKIIEMHPDDYFIYDFRAELFEKMEKYDLAVEDYTRAIELKGDNTGILFETSDLYKSRAKNYAKLEQFDNAISDYSKIIELKPDNVLGYVDRAKTYIQMKEYKKAVADYSKAIEMDPENENFYRRRGECYEKSGEKKLAKADFAKAKKIESERAKKYKNSMKKS